MSRIGEFVATALAHGGDARRVPERRDAEAAELVGLLTGAGWSASAAPT
ncbi:hypothetical protein [Nannocystis pusilla]